MISIIPTMTSGVGYNVPTALNRFACQQLVEAGVSSDGLKNRNHAGLELTIYLSCDTRASNKSWGVPIADGTICFGWSKLTKPRGFDTVEWYLRTNSEVMRDSPDRLKVFLDTIAGGFGFLSDRFGYTFGALNDPQFFATLKKDILTNKAALGMSESERTAAQITGAQLLDLF